MVSKKTIGQSFMAFSVALTLAACTNAAPRQQSETEQSDPQSANSAPQSQDNQQSQPFEPRTATVVMSGDLLWHSDLWRAAEEVAAETGRGPYDFSRLFQDMRPTIESADMAICHEEVPLAPDGQIPTGYPMFGAPQQVVEFISETGWDLCTTASNHSLDQGFDGIDTTLRELDRYGILHEGTFRSPEERAQPAIFETENGVRIAVVTGTYSTNGLPLPEGAEWSVAMLDTDDMIARAQAARDAGADIVLAAMHAGDEYQTEPNQEQVDTANALTASDTIDLVYGHHVHVVQPWDKINDKWVAYGLGNMVANHEVGKRRAYEGVTSRFTFTENMDGTFKVTEAEYIPTMVTEWWPGLDLRLWPVVDTLNTGEGQTELLQTAQEMTRAAVTSLGAEGMQQR